MSVESRMQAITGYMQGVQQKSYASEPGCNGTLDDGVAGSSCDNDVGRGSRRMRLRRGRRDKERFAAPANQRQERRDEETFSTSRAAAQTMPSWVA